MSDLATATITMELRERLMEYFKGGCVDHLVETGYVRLSNPDVQIRGSFARDQYTKKNPKLVKIFNIPIMKLTNYPQQITFIDTIERSPQFREIEAQLATFTKTYLQGVEVVHEKGTVTDYAEQPVR